MSRVVLGVFTVGVVGHRVWPCVRVERWHPKGRRINGRESRDGRTLSMIKVGTLSMSNDSAISDCSSASIRSENNFGYSCEVAQAL